VDPRRARRWALVGLAAIVSACSACSGGDLGEAEMRVPVHRFVDPPGAGALTVDRPFATIEDDTRFALAAPRETILVWPKKLPDHDGPRVVKLRPNLTDELAGAARIVVLPNVRIGQEWSTRPPAVVATRGRAKIATARLDVAVPAVPAGTPVLVSATAFALDPLDLSDRRSAPVAIPARASLEFSMGVLLPATGYDPVEFSIEACEAERCERLFDEVLDPSSSDGGAWRDRRLDLSALAGLSRALRFRARRLAEQAPFSLPIWGNPTLYAVAPRPTDAVNVILLSVDTLRADHLTSYGYARDTAPFIEERFGRGGALFESPVAAATITTPSHASMFTSLQPASHGTTDGMKVLPKQIATLPEWIRAAGLDTAAVTEDGWLGIRHGFGRGFDVFEENKSANIMSPDGQVDRTFARAAAWLERHRDKRFFLFLHTFQVHSPYAPPKRYAKLFADAAGVAAPSHERWRDDYDREIRYTDDEVRRLFARLDALGLSERTVFVLTSDHGEAFLEHGLLEHGGRLHEEVVHVPLLFTGPGIPAGRRFGVPVAHVDLLPTILELLHIAPPAWREGRSLVGLLAGREPEAAFADRALFSETRAKTAVVAERGVIPFEVPAFLVRQGTRKLLRYPDGAGGFRYELYDLAADPGERNDLYPSEPDAATGLRALLDGYEAASAAHRAGIDAATGAAAGGSPGTGSGTPAPDEVVPLDPAQEEKLRALGYLE
jgi:arylsulfatase A-like enzyme